jgi:hypothetical protein
MDISSFIQTAFGAVAGGSVVMITNKLAVRAEKRKHVQEWYTQYYIEEGITPLIIYFKRLQLYSLSLKASAHEDTSVVKSVEEAPLDALVRIEALLRKDHFMHIILLVHPCIISESKLHQEAAREAINDSLKILYGLRNAFLESIPKISRIHTEKPIITGKREEELISRDIEEHLAEIYKKLRERLEGIYDKVSKIKEDDTQKLEDYGVQTPQSSNTGN